MIMVNKGDGTYVEVIAIYAKDQDQYREISKGYTQDGELIFSPTYMINESYGYMPFQILADGDNVEDYTIYGNTFQDGTPTPDNPIMPEGTGERTGNLVRFYQEEMQGNFYGVDITVKNAEITLNGTVSSGSGHWVEIGYKFGGGTESTDNVVIPCEPETSYTITTEILDGDSSAVRLIAFGTSIENRTVNIGSSSTTTFSDDINRIFISLGAGGVVFNNLKFRVMFNKGSAQLPYKPYGYKIPISSNSTTTPVYLGEVQSTRRIKKLVLDGSEPWALSAHIVYINNTNTMKLSPLICTHFPNVQNTGMWNGNNWIFQVNISNLGMSGRDAWIAYLQQQYAAGTPVCVWYVLAEPETGIVNEPLCKIGDYADSVDFSQAGVEIPTLKKPNTTVIDVETEVKPSVINLTYWGEWQDKAAYLSSDNKLYITTDNQIYYTKR